MAAADRYGAPVHQYTKASLLVFITDAINQYEYFTKNAVFRALRMANFFNFNYLFNFALVMQQLPAMINTFLWR